MSSSSFAQACHLSTEATQRESETGISSLTDTCINQTCDLSNASALTNYNSPNRDVSIVNQNLSTYHLTATSGLLPVDRKTANAQANCTDPAPNYLLYATLPYYFKLIISDLSMVLRSHFKPQHWQYKYAEIFLLLQEKPKNVIMWQSRLRLTISSKFTVSKNGYFVRQSLAAQNFFQPIHYRPQIAIS